jgi:1-acyl-sn-glycerol-3-phosphate acyltransferase
MTGVIGVQMALRADGPLEKVTLHFFSHPGTLAGPSSADRRAIPYLLLAMILLVLSTSSIVALARWAKNNNTEMTTQCIHWPESSAAFTRAISGVQVRRVTFSDGAAANLFCKSHGHLDFVVLWSALPAEVRARTRPVEAKDYWESGVKAYLAQNVFRAVLVQRGAAAQAVSEEKVRAAGRATIEQLAEALGETDSLILFPEGTRGTGESVAPFRSGLFYLAKRKPDAELVPVYLENLNRILPKGEVLPVPLISSLTFGAPMHVEESESKEAFLERTRAAVSADRPSPC